MAYSKRRSHRRKGSRKNMRRSRQRRGMKKGGCGCDNKSIFSGGSNQLGPSPGLDQLPVRSYYDVNSYDNDPNSPDAVMSTRIQPNMTGGRKRRRSKSSRRSRRHKRGGTNPAIIKGGGMLDGWMGTDPISSFGNAPGAFNANELARGNFGANPNPSVQQVTQMFNANNSQLV